MDPIVLDAGHGGDRPAGGSTPIGVQGPGGSLEKDLTLELALRVREGLLTLGRDALVTRDSDENPTLAERTFCSRGEEACAFISLHFDSCQPKARGCQVWVHERASSESQHLADEVLEALHAVTGARAPAPLSGPMAVLDPAFHPPGCVACLVEVGCLNDPDEETRLREGGYVDSIAWALARGILCGLPDLEERGPFSVHAAEEHFDIWHEVPLVQQLTGMSCWAAAAAMLVGWRECIDIDAEEVAAGAGRWEEYRDGLTPEDVQALAEAWGLVVEPPRRYTVQALRELLENNGPLWVGEASPGLHVVVVTGMRGDGSPEATRVRIADPWPIGRGERYSITFAELMRHLEAAAGISGGPAQLLHAGGRGRSRSVFRQRREMEVRFDAGRRSVQVGPTV
jgi:hypothetical protein